MHGNYNICRAADNGIYLQQAVVVLFSDKLLGISVEHFCSGSMVEPVSTINIYVVYSTRYRLDQYCKHDPDQNLD